MIYDSGVSERASFQVNISQDGSFLFYLFEGFKNQNYYPDDTGVEIISLDKDYHLEKIKSKTPMIPVWFYLISNSEGDTSQIMIFDTRTLIIYTKENFLEEKVLCMDIVNDEVILFTKGLGEYTHSVNIKEFSKLFFGF